MSENLNRSAKKSVITQVCRPSNYGQDSFNKEPNTQMLIIINTFFNHKIYACHGVDSYHKSNITNLKVLGE